MKRIIFVLVIMAAALAIAACSLQRTPASQKRGGHPTLSEQQMLIACASCHQQATPKVYDAWYDSTHGIGNVKCYQCHGTFENLAKTPDLGNCNACHTDKMGAHRAGKTCWECHSPHSFALN